MRGWAIATRFWTWTCAISRLVQANCSAARVTRRAPFHKENYGVEPDGLSDARLRIPTRAVDTVARRWRWLRASVCDPYRPELHYMRWARTKMAREARARRWVVEQGALATRQIRRSAKCAGKH